LLPQQPCLELSGRHFSVFAVMSWQSCLLCPVQAHLCRLTCQADLSRLACPDCPVQVVLSQLSCPRCPIPVILS
jgi:hypothetical protein